MTAQELPDLSDVRARVMVAFDELAGSRFKSDSSAIDLGAERMRRKICRLNRSDFGFLNYFYSQDSIKYKPWAFVRVWTDCDSIISGQTTAMKKYAAEMLQLLLSLYHREIQDQTPMPEQPWLKLEGITEAAWREDLLALWEGMLEALESADRELLCFL